jgi:anti-sigma B factor antagonist
MPFDIDRKNLDSGIVVLAISGTMTMGNQVQKFEWDVEALIKNGHNRIVLDMSRTTYLDSSAVGILVACHGKTRESGGELRLAGITDRVKMILTMTGVDQVLHLHPTNDEAVAAAVAKG